MLTQTDRTILLTFNRKDFEEIYFRDGRDKIFFSSIAKTQTYLAIVSIGLVIASLIYKFLFDSSSTLFVFFLIALFICSIDLFRRVRSIFKWRKSIKVYLDDVGKHNIHKIVLSENAFTLIQDSNEFIERWSEFKKAEITEKSISLTSDKTYLIPKKSMTPEEFEYLKAEVKMRIKNG